MKRIENIKKKDKKSGRRRTKSIQMNASMILGTKWSLKYHHAHKKKRNKKKTAFNGLLVAMFKKKHDPWLLSLFYQRGQSCDSIISRSRPFFNSFFLLFFLLIGGPFVRRSLHYWNLPKKKKIKKNLKKGKFHQVVARVGSRQRNSMFFFLFFLRVWGRILGKKNFFLMKKKAAPHYSNNDGRNSTTPDRRRGRRVNKK